MLENHLAMEDAEIRVKKHNEGWSIPEWYESKQSDDDFLMWCACFDDKED